MARVKTEQKVVENIKDMFTMLFAPQEVVFRTEVDLSTRSANQIERIDDNSFSIPIKGADRLLGLIEVLNLALPEHREQYINLATKIINICGLAIENAQHYQQIKDTSDTDGLTGLANRRKLENHLGQEWRRMMRSGNALTLMMVDIDYFKQYNDLYGHLAGDNCLKQVAQLLKEFSRRPGDLAARYGDEEFTLVFPDVELKKASYLAKSIQKAVDNLQIKHECSKAGSYVTVSIGAVSKIPNDSSSPTELISEADKNLYKAKAAGRNTFFIL